VPYGMDSKLNEHSTSGDTRHPITSKTELHSGVIPRSDTSRTLYSGMRSQVTALLSCLLGQSGALVFSVLLLLTREISNVDYIIIFLTAYTGSIFMYVMLLHRLYTITMEIYFLVRTQRPPTRSPIQRQHTVSRQVIIGDI